jgi:hypothetical protein
MDCHKAYHLTFWSPDVMHGAAAYSKQYLKLDRSKKSVD